MGQRSSGLLVRNQDGKCRPGTIISSAIRHASGRVAEALQVNPGVQVGLNFPDLLVRNPRCQSASISQKIRGFGGASGVWLFWPATR
jgi:hypothetical protein